MALIIESKKEVINEHTRGWEFALKCTECKGQFSCFSTVPEIGRVHCHRCGSGCMKDDGTEVIDMNLVFDEHLAASLPVTIIDQLEKLPHLRRLGSNNLQRLQAIMDLMRHPNNMLQLWVWTRMCWTFGSWDAQVAAKNFNELMGLIDSSDIRALGPCGLVQPLIDYLRALVAKDNKFPQWKEYRAFMGGLSEDDPNA